MNSLQTEQHRMGSFRSPWSWASGVAVLIVRFPIAAGATHTGSRDGWVLKDPTQALATVYFHPANSCTLNRRFSRRQALLSCFSLFSFIHTRFWHTHCFGLGMALWNKISVLV